MSEPASAFRAADYQVFRYLGYEAVEGTGEVAFRYELAPAVESAQAHGAADALPFTERVTLALPEDPASADWAAARGVLVLLGAVLGLSYYKAAAPGRYEIAPDGITQAGLVFLRAAVRDGLAEFAYRSGFPTLLQPEIAASPADPAPTRPVAADRLEQPLVPIGGGKDSVVTVESLGLAGMPVTQFAVNPNSIIERVAAASRRPFISARRHIDPALLEANRRGALNGHVPVTAMNSLIAVAQSLLLGLGPVVMSNESSASDPTLDWNGVPVNHQWSKSLEAETLLAAAIEAQTGIRGLYFSLLRPFSELKIAGKFSRIEGYDDAIVSCNRAYRMGTENPVWCGECAKCQFVFLAFSPFMSRARLTSILGKNLFEDESLTGGYRELLGLDAHKPFECVGEEAESTVAMSLAARSDQWRDTPVVRALVAEAPSLAEGDAALEDEVFADAPAPQLPSDAYREALNALH